jgi:hypothetical protein
MRRSASGNRRRQQPGKQPVNSERADTAPHLLGNLVYEESPVIKAVTPLGRQLRRAYINTSLHRHTPESTAGTHDQDALEPSDI